MSCGNCNCGSSLCLATGPKGDKGDTGPTGPAGSDATDLKGTMLNLDSVVIDTALTGAYATVSTCTYTVTSTHDGETLYIEGSVAATMDKEGDCTFAIHINGTIASIASEISIDETLAGADTFDASFTLQGSVRHSYTCSTGDVITLQATGDGTLKKGELFIQIV